MLRSQFFQYFDESTRSGQKITHYLDQPTDQLLTMIKRRKIQREKKTSIHTRTAINNQTKVQHQPTNQPTTKKSAFNELFYRLLSCEYWIPLPIFFFIFSIIVYALTKLFFMDLIVHQIVIIFCLPIHVCVCVSACLPLCL